MTRWPIAGLSSLRSDHVHNQVRDLVCSQSWHDDCIDFVVALLSSRKLRPGRDVGRELDRLGFYPPAEPMRGRRRQRPTRMRHCMDCGRRWLPPQYVSTRLVTFLCSRLRDRKYAFAYEERPGHCMECRAHARAYAHQVTMDESEGFVRRRRLELLDGRWMASDWTAEFSLLVEQPEASEADPLPIEESPNRAALERAQALGAQFVERKLLTENPKVLRAQIERYKRIAGDGALPKAIKRELRRFQGQNA